MQSRQNTGITPLLKILYVVGDHQLLFLIFSEIFVSIHICGIPSHCNEGIIQAIPRQNDILFINDNGANLSEHRHTAPELLQLLFSMYPDILFRLYQISQFHLYYFHVRILQNDLVGASATYDLYAICK